MTTVPDLVHFLTVQARWAANSHPAFPEFCADMRDLRATLEAATSRTRKPTKANASCFADGCGGDLVKRVVESNVVVGLAVPKQWWLPGGIGPMPAPQRLAERTGKLEEDLWTCVKCREQYDRKRYRLALAEDAKKAAWITRDGEQWATHAAMAGELRRSETTIRVWVHRGLVRQRSVERVLFVSAMDCRARDERRAG